MPYKPIYRINNKGKQKKPAPSAATTNTRSTISTCFDHEGVVVEGLATESMLEGGRREQTRTQKPRDFSQAATDILGWRHQGNDTITLEANAEPDRYGIEGMADTIEVTTDASPDTLMNHRVLLAGHVMAGSDWNISFWIKGLNGTTNWTININDGTHNRVDLNITSEWVRYSMNITGISSTRLAIYCLDTRSGHMDSGTYKAAIDFAMDSNVSGRSNKSPPEFIDIGIDYGSGVNGVRWYDSVNENVVINNVVYEAFE